MLKTQFNLYLKWFVMPVFGSVMLYIFCVWLFIEYTNNPLELEERWFELYFPIGLAVILPLLIKKKVKKIFTRLKIKRESYLYLPYFISIFLMTAMSYLYYESHINHSVILNDITYINQKNDAYYEINNVIVKKERYKGIINTDTTLPGRHTKSKFIVNVFFVAPMYTPHNLQTPTAWLATLYSKRVRNNLSNEEKQKNAAGI